MPRLLLPLLLFLAGLAAPVWIGAGYLGHHATGAAVCALIAACYLVGALELRRYQRSSQALADALLATERDVTAWLGRIPQELRGAVRLRIEGDRVALPGPALTPYLVGLLVLLGMLGTLLGMMATLRGTGIALQSATDLQAIRGSLASPVEGLAVAFGTSIAGVAASAMLGLLSALLRRERGVVVQALDAHIATERHEHSRSWQRSESLRLQQLQAQSLPPLVEQLRSLADTLQHAHGQHNEQMQLRQHEFHARSESSQQQLAALLQEVVQRSAQDSTRAMIAAVQPMVQQTLDGLAAAAAQQQATVDAAVQHQLRALQQSARDAGRHAGSALDAALDGLQQGQQALLEGLRGTLEHTATAQQQANEHLLEKVAHHLQQQAGTSAETWREALHGQQASGQALAQRHEQALAQALDAQQQTATDLLRQIGVAAQALQEQAAQQDQQRLQHWQQAFTALADGTRERWQQAGQAQLEQSQHIVDALAQAAERSSEQTRQHAASTIAEISRLVDAAAEAPRAAAGVIGELRQQLSESMARDNLQLEERTQLLATLQALMEAVNHAAGEQQRAVDALIERATGTLQHTGERFAEQVAEGSGRLDALAGQLAEGAQGVTALASGLDAAVQAFCSGSTTLSDHLQTLSTALDASLARSDEQLAYYVAQAREVVDLTLMSQKQVLDELQQLARLPAGSTP